MEAAEARRRLAGARVVRLATVTAAGRPHVVPCCFVLDGDVWYSAVDGKPKTTRRLRRLDNVAAGGRASVLADHYDEDWSRLWWVRADGAARVLPEGPEADRARAGLAARYRQYQAVALDGPVLALSIERWTGWSASGGR